jgi:8-oxo-dGTP pyrophosphatase MutT (NUDIX family)
VSGIAELLKPGLLPATQDPRLPSGTPSGVLVPVIERPGRPPALLLTVRSQEVRDHKGEISFPGGVRHREDPDLATTAVRETEEELGIRRDGYELIGALPPVHTVVTGYVIVPFVAVLPDLPRLDPSPVEIAEVVEMEIESLARVEEEISLEASPRTPGRTPSQGWFAYTLDGRTVWGATGRIVHSFLETLRRAGWQGGREGG